MADRHEIGSGVSVLVTGGAGFIPSHVVDRLVEMGASVVVLDDLSYGRRENVHVAAEHVLGDVRDPDTVAALVSRADVVFHLAADTRTRETAMGWDGPAHDLAVNGAGTLTVLEAVRRRNPEAKVLLASSAAVYGPPRYTPVDEDHPTAPISPYGVSKLASDRYAHAYASQQGLDVISARIFNTYGPRQRRYVMYDLIMKLRDDPDRLIVMGTGEQIRDYVYVSDTVDALLALATTPGIESGSVFNIASGSPVRMLDLAQSIVELVAPGAEVSTTGHSWSGDIDVLLGDPSRLRSTTGMEPRVELEDGLRQLVDWVILES